MTPANVPNLTSARGEQQAALTCYQSVILAIAKCMAEVCPGVGLVYNHRLVRLPRRLGFDPTPGALSASREAVEADLAAYTQAARAWINAGAALARAVLQAPAEPAENNRHPGDVHAAMLEDLAEQMEVSAEVDDAAQVRMALRRYATGVRSYVQRRKREEPPAHSELQSRAQALAAWLENTDSSNFIDPLTGLLNRAEAERQLQAHLTADQPFCVMLFEWAELRNVPSEFGCSGTDQILKALGEHLITLVRPHDVVYRWSQYQLAVIVECAAEKALARSRKMADWLSSKYSAVVDGIVWKVEAKTAVALIESHANEPLQDFVQRIDKAITPVPAPVG